MYNVYKVGKRTVKIKKNSLSFYVFLDAKNKMF